uniref:Low-density lipoprotein receptor-related protein 5-like n=1 Tax=Saccoglossus kowalevskii TaxID=10224 RepID=A0ABM0M6X2_SACKO|nr:PREDICTED: low-density lipoprotein receptor-related protein 5-like [Saccoglossus kowalevskii]
MSVKHESVEESRLIWSGVRSHLGQVLESTIKSADGGGESLYQHIQTRNVSLQIDTILSEIAGFKGPMTFDYRKSLLFWADTVGKKIFKMALLSGDVIEIYDGTSNDVSGIAADWVSGNIYWCDAAYDWIMISDYGGNYHRTVQSTGLDEPGDIVVDPARGKLYWSDWEKNPRIEYSNLMGGERSIFVGGYDDFGSPHGLAIDYVENRLYWSDVAHEAIFNIDLDDPGPNRDIIIVLQSSTLLFYPFHIDLDSNSTVMIGNVTKILEPISFSTGFSAPIGVVFYSITRQPSHNSSCLYDNGGCDHLCITDPIETACQCNHGHALGDDGVSCNEDNHLTPGDYILLADSSDISVMPVNVGDINDLSVSMLPIAHLYVTSMDYDHNQDMLYVYHPGNRGIWRTVLRDDEHFENVHQNVGDVGGIAIDWLASNLYWTDVDHSVIMISKLDGMFAITLVSTDIHKPRAIVVHPHQRYLIWSDIGMFPKIERTSLSGKERMSLVDFNILRPVAMALDYSNDILFWADETRGTIESITITGSARTVIDSSNSVRTIGGLAVFQDILIWTETDNLALEIIDFDSGQHKQRITTPDPPGPITVFANSRQQTAADERCQLTFPHGRMEEACDNSLGGVCRFVCENEFYAAHSGTVTCLTDAQWDMDVDDLCVFDIALDDFLLIVAKDGIHYIDLTSPEHDVLPLRDVQYPLGVEFDSHTDTLYWTDISLRAIAKTRLDGSQSEIIIDQDIMYPDGIAIDTENEMLYWADSEVDRIESASYDGSNRRPLVVYDMDEPRALILHQTQQVLYWSDWGKDPRIEACHVDGTNRRIIVQDDLGMPLGLAFDTLEEKLYWCDSSRHVIESCNLDGSGRQAVFDIAADSSCYGLVVTDTYVYWTDFISGAVHEINRHTHEDSNLVMEGFHMDSPKDVKRYTQLSILTTMSAEPTTDVTASNNTYLNISGDIRRFTYPSNSQSMTIIGVVVGIVALILVVGGVVLIFISFRKQSVLLKNCFGNNVTETELELEVPKPIYNEVEFEINRNGATRNPIYSENGSMSDPPDHVLIPVDSRDIQIVQTHI